MTAELVSPGDARPGNTVAPSAPATDRDRPRSRAPRVRRVALEPPGPLYRGRELRALTDVEHPDGGEIELSYAWFVNDDEVWDEGPTFSTRDLRRGDRVRVRVTADDGSAPGTSLESPERRIENGPPRIEELPVANDADGRLELQIRAADPDGDEPLLYRLIEGPRGLELDESDGRIRWEPAPDQRGRHFVEISVEDGLGAASSSRFELRVGETP